MFVCKECGMEYEIKPDYCECGNDTFDEIIPKPPIEEKKETPQKTSEPVKKIKTKSNRYDSFYYEKIKNFFDPISTIFFLVCIVLSFIIIFFIGNPKEENTTTQHKTTVNKETSNIPSIDKIWNSTPPVVKEETKQDIQPVKPVEQIKTVQNIKKIITTPVKNTVKKAETKPVKKVVEQKQNTTNTTPKKTVAPPQVTKPVSTQPQVNKQELSNYKIKLRNRIASKIDFASIVGDGTCSVSFKVTSSGQLTDKKFIQQSQNFSLNDMVYNALLKTSYYNPPPTSYNGTTLKMTVKMYDGNFEVTLN